ncbi:MAG: Lrp/AsnC family transcriptional regulator [Candidatus Helarchaeota archaeon]
MKYKISELDKKILKELKENSRIPFTQLANKLNIPDTTLHFHVKKMRENNIIKKFTIILGDFGEKITVLLKIKIGGHIIREVSENKAKMLGEKLKTKFSFIAISDDKVSIFGIISLRNEEELNKLLVELKRDPDIIQIEHNILDIIKGNEFINLEIE